ncbi:unnamed protein product, partial [marine sediment metagenome]
MRLTKFEETVTRANAKYFYAEKFITKKQYYSVMKWLEGKDDKEGEALATKWMKANFMYAKEIGLVTMKRFWFIAPIVFMGLKLIRRT